MSLRIGKAIFLLGCLLPLTVFAADVVVNSSQTFQTISGWGQSGGSISFLELTFLDPSVADPVNYQILDFAVDDLGLTGGRLTEIGPRGDGKGADNGDCDAIDWTKFQVGPLDPRIGNYINYFKNRVVAHGYQPCFYSSPNYMNFSTSTRPWMLNHPGERAQQLWSNALFWKENYGININYAVIANEPQGGSYTPLILSDDIKALGPRLAALGLTTQSQYAECVSPITDWTDITAVQNDPDMWPYVGRLSYHKYGAADPYRAYIRDLAKAKGITAAQTENDIVSGHIDELIDDLTVGGVSYWETAYSWQEILKPNSGYTSFTPSNYYFPLRQVLHYVRPGAIRIGTATSDPTLRILAFSQNGAVTTIIEVNSATPETINLSGLPPGAYGLSEVIRQGTGDGNSGSQTTATPTFKELGIQTVPASGMLTISNLPGAALITLYPHTSPNLPPTIMTYGSNPGYLTTPASTATLSVTANDPENTPLTYSWSVTSQPAGANAILATPTAATTNVSGLSVAGTYIFNINVMDGVNTSSKQVYLIVYSSNQAPVIGPSGVGFRIGAPFGYEFGDPNGSTPIHGNIELPTSSVTLSANVSDLENDALTGLWTLVGQPAGANVTIGASTYQALSYRATVSNMTVVGDYTFQLALSDPTHTVTRQVVCTVNPATSGPVIASITPTPATITSPVSSLQLAAATSDPAAQLLRHWWYVKSVPAGGKPVFDHQGLPNTNVSNLTIPGVYTFTLRCFDDIHMTTKDVSVTVNPAPGAPVISSPAVAAVVSGSPFTYTITASNGPGSYNATYLPAGLTVNSATGMITGTPKVAGIYNITVSATNVSGTGYGNLALTVNLPLPAISSAANADGIVNTPFGYAIIVASNIATSYTALGLPAGLTVDPLRGTITGTPTTSGNYTVTIGATNSTGTTTATLNLVIYPAAPSAPVINSALSATGTVGSSFNYAITATNSPTSYFAIGLPSGLSFDQANGGISGVPNVAGSFSVTLRALNAGGTGSATLALTINPSAQPPALTSAASATGTVGSAFYYAITATNGPTGFNATNLPAGLAVNIATGVISGTPTTVGVSTVALSATNAAGTGNATLSLTISPPAPVIASAATATGTVGSAFSYTITATNNPTSYSFTGLPLGLPAGLALNTATGVISGTPTTQGVSTVTIIAANSAGAGNETLIVTINPAAPAPSITSPLSATGTVGVAFSYTITATNSPTSYNALGLPAGLTVNTATGVISGTPSAVGNSSITISATNAGGTGSATLTLTVGVTTTPAITTTSPLAGGDVGTAYSQTFAASNGTPPYTWSVSAGAVPAGLTVSAAGVLSGTPTTAGASNFTVLVTDATSATASKAFALTINAAPSITSASPLASGDLGAVYTQTFAVSGGTAPFTWSVSAGALPAGLNLSAAGVLSGTPTTAGVSNFTVLVTDATSATANKLFALTINAALSITTASPLASGDVGTAYSQTFSASGGTVPLTWSVSAGALPAGLNLSATGVLSGTPTTAGVSNFTVLVTDAVSATSNKAFALTINPSSTPPSITTVSPLATGEVAAAYSQTFAATGGTAPYFWSISAGALPAGLNLSAAGALSGTPTTAGTFNFTVLVTDAASATASKAFALTINAAPLITTTSPLPNGTANAVYSQTFAASGGTAPFAWSVSSGSLPAGLSLSAAGVLSGTPTTAGASMFTVNVADGAGGSATKAFALTVNPANQAPVISSQAAANPNPATTGQTVAFSVTATDPDGDTLTYAWAFGDGAAGSGAAVNHVYASAGVYSATVTVSDTGGLTAASNVSVTVVNPVTALSITTTSLPNGAINAAYSQTLAASGGQPPYSWSISSGSLPAGLSLSAAGVIGGTPTAVTIANFTVQATDSANTTATQALSLTISDLSLVGFWKFDDGSGATALDSSGYGNTGTLVNGPTWTTGKVNGALSFNGGNSLVSVPDTASLNSDQITVAAWINTDNPNSAKQQFIISKQKPSRAFAFKLQSGRVQFWASNTGPLGATTLQANTWYYVAGTYDGSTVKVYVNGALDASQAATLPPGWNNAQTLTIGGPNFTASFAESFSGILDEVRVYNRALSPSEIQALQSSTLQTPTGPVIVTPAQLPLTVARVQGNANFKTPGQDNVAISGTIVVPGGAMSLSTQKAMSNFNLAGQAITMDIGGAVAVFTLDKNGKAKSSNGTIALRPNKIGAFSFTAKLWGGESVADAWGIDPNATVSKQQLSMVALVQFDGNVYSTPITTTYTSKANVGAKFSGK